MMKPEQIERVFGRGRLRMATGEHVEVFREAVAPTERRRYTKRFLATDDADFRHWTEREWRILARLIGHGIRCVPDVVQFDGGAHGGMRQVQTYDAGVTVDQWATLLPVSRAGVARRHVFEDCAHWFALAHHCLAALEEIHALQLVHLDVKADNICIPYGPAGFDPQSEVRLHAEFPRLALIDFAFSLVSREKLATPLPIGWQKDYDYQSPRLLRALEAGRAGDLQPTQELDWRCDLYSLAAMLRRYLPDDEWARSAGADAGWTAPRYDDARTLVYRLRECHDRDFPHWRPHRELMEITGAHLAAPDLARSLADGWLLARDADSPVATALVTPMTRIALGRTAPTRVALIAPSTRVPAAPPIHLSTTLPAVLRNPRLRPAVWVTPAAAPAPVHAVVRRHRAPGIAIAATVAALAGFAAPSFVDDASRSPTDPGTPATQASAPATQASAPATPMSAPATTTSAPAQTSAPAKVGAASADTDAERTEPEPPRAQAPAPPPRMDAPVTAASSSPPATMRGHPRYPVDRIALGGSPPDPSTHAASAAKGATMRRAPRDRAAPPRPGPSAPAQIASAARVAPSLAVAKPGARSSAHQALQGAEIAVEPPSAAPAAPATGATSAPIAVATAAPATGAISPPLAVATTAPNDARVESSALPETRIAATVPAPVEPQRPAPPVRSTAPSTASAKPARHDPWRAALHDVLQLLGPVVQRPAPVEERSVQNPALARAAPAPDRPAPRATPNADARPPEAPRVAPAQPPQAIPPPEFATRPVPVPGTAVVEARLPLPDTRQDDLGIQAKRMLADAVPRIAAQATADAYPVLWAGAMAGSVAQDRAVVDAAYVPWRSERAYPVTAGDAARARQLHDQARQAYAAGRDTDALDLALRSFAANPRDPDAAGFLAFLHLTLRPSQPETARQLALHALAFSGARRSLRLDDWRTLAVASALSGREVDATRAFLVELALSDDADRSCRSALAAYATFGERLRMPVEAVLRRAHAQGRDYDAAACGAPAYRTVARWP